MGYPLARSDKPQHDPRVVRRPCDDPVKISRASLRLCRRVLPAHRQEYPLRFGYAGPITIPFDDGEDRAAVPFYDLVAIAGG